MSASATDRNGCEEGDSEANAKRAPLILLNKHVLKDKMILFYEHMQLYKHVLPRQHMIVINI